MQKKIFFWGKFYFFKKKRSFFQPFFCFLQPAFGHGRLGHPQSLEYSSSFSLRGGGAIFRVGEISLLTEYYKDYLVQATMIEYWL